MSPTVQTIKFGDNLAVTDETGGVIRVDAGMLWVDAQDVGIGAYPMSYGTTLPASPANGQEAILVDSTTNPAYQWRLRYNGNNSTAYKWEFIGGTPLTGYSAAQQGVSADTWTSFAPTLTTPRAGIYDIELRGMARPPGVAQLYASCYTGSSTFGNIAYTMVSTAYGFVMLTSISAGQVLSAAQVISWGANSNVAATTFEQRYLIMTPVRVS